MRDKLKNEEYWNERIFHTENLRKQRYEKMKNGLIAEDRINIVKRSMAYSYVDSISAKYSAGYPITDLTDDLLTAINLTDESWVDNAWKIYYKNQYLNQYGLSTYDQMLWMLSLGYLLDISNEEFEKLVDVIDRDCVKDFLFEFIIRAKINDREPIMEESYQKYFGIPKIFDNLRKAIVEPDKKNAESLVKQFVRQWYVKHKSQGWYNSHNSPHDIYDGYWSFETAAVVKIMELDDSSFRDCQYYPKDLVCDTNDINKNYI
jgi:hypothetical protein